MISIRQCKKHILNKTLSALQSGHLPYHHESICIYLITFNYTCHVGHMYKDNYVAYFC